VKLYTLLNVNDLESIGGEKREDIRYFYDDIFSGKLFYKAFPEKQFYA